MTRQSRNAVADTDQAVSVAWPPFTQQLAGVLGALEEDQFLVITVKRTKDFPVTFVPQLQSGQALVLPFRAGEYLA